MNRKKVSLILLGVVCIILVGGGIWQQDNIRAIVDSSRYSKKEISQKINHDKKELKQKMQKTVPNLVRDFTPEEKQEIASGKVSMDEMVKKIVSEAQTGNSTTADAKNASSEKNASAASSKQVKIDAAVNEKVAKMYALEAYYLGQLDTLASNVKSKGVSSAISRALALQSQCDSEVYGTLSALKVQLENLGGDVSIVNSLKQSYEKEKSLKKAYYMRLLK